MKVYFITSDYASDKFFAAFDAAERRGDFAASADIVLEDDPAVSVAEELRITTCLNCKTPIVMTPSLTGTAWTTKEGAGA